MVRAQYKELEMSIVGQGDLVLHNSFKKYAVPIHVWCLKKSMAERQSSKKVPATTTQTECQLS